MVEKMGPRLRGHSLQPEEARMQDHATWGPPFLPSLFNTFQDCLCFQVITEVKFDKLVTLIRSYGMNFKDTLVYDRIREELRIFCANHTIDEARSFFLHTESELIESLKLGNVWVFVRHIFGPCWPMNQLNKNPNIA